MKIVLFVEIFLSFQKNEGMKIQIWSFGKNHEEYVSAGIEIFTKRINHYCEANWVLLPMSKATLLDIIKKEEAEKILQRLHQDDFLILLDERGTNWNNQDIAKQIEKCQNIAVKKLVFLIGGAYGVDELIMKRANAVWSLSKLVFPHMLVRLILAEQIYRSFTILRNEKYHHT